MGLSVCAAVEDDPDLELAAAVDPARAGEVVARSGLQAAPGPEAMAGAGVEVAVDFTVAAAAEGNLGWCADHGVHAVVGTTGLAARAVAALKARFEAGPANCVLAPNFAIGAVLMMRFAELAAPWFETVEVVELHHDTKRDAPSGTSVLTAQRVAAARAGAPKGVGATEGGGGAGTDMEVPAARGQEVAPGVRVHSIRLRGLVAHQEVIFGTTGETLTVRHDSLDRASFMPGVLLAVKQVPHRRGFTVGLDALLGL
jgi:4-hydroxy-tetrahydrodipicolinate reductase